MKRTILSLAFICCLAISAYSQKYLTKSAHLSFFSKTKLENIEAHSRQATSALNIETGDLVFKVGMTTFQFEKALMQEHFNEKYVESEKYPEAIFKGKITNLSEVNFKKDGTYKATVTGDLTLHGVTKKVTTTGTITVAGGKISAVAAFPVLIKDYNISIPNAVKDNISETVEVKVDATYSPL
ncbi:MAG: YceI family protein [Chitinophagales bacterium]|nr:YceI family protein [Chitinophagales bacterium]